MFWRLFTVVLVFVCGAPTFAQEQTDPQGPDSVFGFDKVWEIHIQFEADQWQAVQPPEDINWDAGDAFDGLIRDAMRGGNFHSEKSSRPGLAGYMGADHQYGKATVTIGDETISDVGVRYKGNGTFLTGHESGKFSFKIDFNEFVDDQEFRGLTKLNLNSCVNDPSMVREALSYQVFREAGIPAPRVAWAKVFVTVTGEQDRRYHGLYELLEQVDKRFLKSRYGSAKGLLVKPSTFGAFRYLGEDWSPYVAAYIPKTDGNEEQQKRFIDMARLVHKSDDDAFEKQIEEYLDVDQFLNFLAVNVLLSNLDSFLAGSQNYYAYLEPTSNKIQLLPWDLDNSFGSLDMVGTPEGRRKLSIDHPQVGNDHRFIERILAVPRFREAYHARLGELCETIFKEEDMLRRIDDAREFLLPHVQLEGEEAVERFRASLGESPTRDMPNVLKHFVVERRSSIRNQLAGESKGQRVDWAMIPPEILRLWIAIGIAFFLALLLNAVAWLWCAFSGFRINTKWGILNMCFYPVSPMVYGFYAHQEFGRKAAIMATVCTFVFICVIAVSIAVTS